MEQIELIFSRLSAPARHELLLRLMNLNNQLLMSTSPSIETIPAYTRSNIINDQGPSLMIPSDQEPGPVMMEVEANPINPTNPINPVNVRKWHNEDLKKEAVKLALEYNNNAKAAAEVMKKYNLRQLDESSIREWINAHKYCTKEEVEKAKKKVQIRSTQARYKEIEDHLINWIKEMRKKKLAISYKMIKEEALKVSNDPEFKATPGWFQRAKKRMKLARRVPTHIIQKLCEKSGKDIQIYLAKLQQLKLDILTKPRGADIIFCNFDETPLQFDMASGKTYDFRGVKEVCIQTTKGTKMRFTALLSMLSTGIMLPPLFIFKSKKALCQDLKKKFNNDCLIFANEKGWVTEEIMLEWLNKVWFNLNFPNTISPVLIFDKCAVHVAAKITSFLESKACTYAVIPPGTTGYLQPLDVSVNKPFKTNMKAQFEDWFQKTGITNSNKTPAGYLRPPSIETVIKWALEENKSIKEDLIIISFKTTGI